MGGPHGWLGRWQSSWDALGAPLPRQAPMSGPDGGLPVLDAAGRYGWIWIHERVFRRGKSGEIRVSHLRRSVRK